MPRRKAIQLLFGAVLAFLSVAHAERFEALNIGLGSDPRPIAFRDGVLMNLDEIGRSASGLYFVKPATFGKEPLIVSDDSGTPNIQAFAEFGGYALVQVGGTRVYATDGTTQGTAEIRSFAGEGKTLNFPSPSRGARSNGDIGCFIVRPSGGPGTISLWRTQGTANSTQPLLDIPGSETAQTVFVGFGEGKIFWQLAGVNGEYRSQLWTADMSTGNATLVLDLGADHVEDDLTHAAGLWYFERSNQQEKKELWRTDGTAAGTFKLKDTHPGGNIGRYHRVLMHAGRDRLYFEEICRGTDCDYVRHYTTDGTVDGTTTYELPGVDPKAWELAQVLDNGMLLARNPTSGEGPPMVRILNRNTNQVIDILGSGVYAEIESVIADGERIYFSHRGDFDADPTDAVPAAPLATLFAADLAPGSARPVLCNPADLLGNLRDLKAAPPGLYGTDNYYVIFRRVEGETCPPPREGPENGVHSADTDNDGRLRLPEILRIVQVYNSPGYHCANGPYATEDGFALGPGDLTACEPHDADLPPQDWAFNITEVLRTIQIYASTGYTYCPEANTEDGFCPGP